MLTSEEALANSLLCFIDKTHDSFVIQLWKIIHQAYVFIHQITITIQKTLLCVIQFQFFYVFVSIHDRMPQVTGTLPGEQPHKR